jgi:hypothetical protein
MPNVAFCREIKPGARGKDVIAHKRAISRANPKAYPWHDFSPFYGPIFKNAVIKMFPQSNGIITSSRHEALERKKAYKKDEPAFDAMATKLAQDYCSAFGKQHVRDEIVEAAFYWYAHRYDMDDYSQKRAGEMCKPPQVPDEWDCSMFVTNAHYAGGAPDPNRLNFSGYGYTGSLLAGGKRCNFSELAPGDAIMYGYTTRAKPGFPVGSPTHVALYVGNKKVLSMGSYPMKYLEYDYRSINCYVHYNI